MKSKIKKRTISSALIEKYITGKTTLDEWIHVITAIKRKPSVRKKVEESRRIFNELYGNAPCSNPESRKDGYTEKGL